MTKVFKQGRILTAFIVALCLMTVMAVTAFADSRTQLLTPVNGGVYSGPLTAIVWSKTSDVKASQINITALDGSFVYNSGPIYMTPGSSGYYVHNLPYSVYSTMPTGKAYSVYVEDYHYSGDTYTGFSSDQAFFSIIP
ncbi:hypothetical protein D3P09_03595 [Paenibacillus pinisoli]|uniref:Uncharacterized protein n=1 Tax=Paenibacillus pinisoli TaxID=1276110 RepID=A0A3A6PL59_9BACL|nr:hypothetical protein [Paenibacillus pinisoli]RJX41100.1 hypothetical protein D3P09_03595 [Paenibacillus pinisoli]